MRNSALLLGFLASVAASGAADAQSAYYSNYYSFGDSLSDTGRVLRETGFDGPAVIATVFQGPGIYQPHAGIYSNAPNFLQVLPGLVGLPYVASNNYGIGYATSGDQPPFALTSPTYPLGFKNQIDQFLARGGSFGPRDIINVWFGFNDISTIPADATAPEVTAALGTIYSNIGSGIARLEAAGGRNFVVFDTQTYRSGVDSPIAAQFNRNFVSQVLQPVADSGANVHFFDVATLSARMRANPTAYGFAADAGTVSCLQDPVCRIDGATTGLENQYISPEGIHFTGRANQIIAAYVANQLNAPLTIGPQAEIASAAEPAFRARSSICSATNATGRSRLPMEREGVPPRRPPQCLWTATAGSGSSSSETSSASIATRDRSRGAGPAAPMSGPISAAPRSGFCTMRCRASPSAAHSTISPPGPTSRVSPRPGSDCTPIKAPSSARYLRIACSWMPSPPMAEETSRSAAPA